MAPNAALGELNLARCTHNEERIVCVAGNAVAKLGHPSKDSIVSDIPEGRSEDRTLGIYVGSVPTQPKPRASGCRVLACRIKA